MARLVSLISEDAYYFLMALPLLGTLAPMAMGLGSGFAFGTGYGAGVRFGYEDVYPYLKGNMSAIANMLQIPFASSGFKLASGVTERQGQGLQAADMVGNGLGLKTPEESMPKLNQTTGETSSQMIDRIRNSANFSSFSYDQRTGEAKIHWKQGSSGVIPMSHPLNGAIQDFIKHRYDKWK